MPICSYVVHPALGREDLLVKRLNGTAGCTAVLSDDQSIVILLTETASAEEEEALQRNLDELNEIRCRALAFAADSSPGCGS